ncbi:hypothetical protein [Longimicrobium terrae]|uniref:Gallidermin/nisin family lantibiotic n=1 Tax=Longimicrobium terrae TaxID=1639882 RepID=A0A841H4F2_9BACT|nr:hypothetical protein [Longimicrobium terrae]MBB4638762.1 hypothetical protein [Longimicrobium terrae]MBB6073001.1 hypothetical protein [Longimicrobium terrae]NNC33125.1 hypothetical protein [Longimicrobium terrae]
MRKSKLDLTRIDVVSFETESSHDVCGANVITGNVCVTRPTIYGSCCTP